MSREVETVVVETYGCIATITHGGDESIEIDWDDAFDYEKAYSLINEVIGSNLDGPIQMVFVAQVATKFLKDQNIDWSPAT